MLLLQNVTKKFVTDDVETLALSDVTLSVTAGELAVITGPSGSGKTTLLNVAGLLETFDSGRHVIADRDIGGLNDAERSKLRREMIGFIFQTFNLLPDLTVFDNVELPLRLRGAPGKVRRQKVAEALDTVGLATRKSHRPSQLSGGQQQRVAIARAIAGDPKIIFADEPTGNLDSKMSDQVMELLREINDRGTTIVMVTHNSSHALLANHLIEVWDGKITRDSRLSAADTTGASKRVALA